MSPPLCSPPDSSDTAPGPGLIPWSREQMYLLWQPQAWRWGFSGNWQYQCEVLTKESRSKSVRCSLASNSLRPCGLQSKLLCPRDSPGKNTGVGCHFLLQGIFPNQGSNLPLLCLLHWQEDCLPLHHPEIPFIDKRSFDFWEINLCHSISQYVLCKDTLYFYYYVLPCLFIYLIISLPLSSIYAY